MSHLNVLDDSLTRGFKRILIWEDDLNFSRDFNKRMAKVLAELDQLQWALFYGGYRMNGAGGRGSLYTFYSASGSNLTLGTGGSGRL